ncbi:MAG: methionine--tRNA ligase subunit beta [Gammaproteobacteria bacterium]|jgi:methionyl-tRNA synthetase|tara:strand:- start:704 stop:1036 length:333 start_codon:yes stop_codon:yes gene_type:complete
MDEITIDDFFKIDLRVAKIVEVSDLEEADKLVRLKLDIGNLGTKTVFAGIKKYYDSENLLNKMVVCVNNLKPREMRFGTSEGMILAASDEESGVYLISPDMNATPGMRVS